MGRSEVKVKSEWARVGRSGSEWIRVDRSVSEWV